MKSQHYAKAKWEGSLAKGKGTFSLKTSGFETSYSATTRFEGKGSSPEELIGAANAACFNMALSKLLTDKGHEPEKLETSAEVILEKTEGGISINRINLETEGTVSGIDAELFQDLAEDAKENCPVSQAWSVARKSGSMQHLNNSHETDFIAPVAYYFAIHHIWPGLQNRYWS